MYNKIIMHCAHSEKFGFAFRKAKFVVNFVITVHNSILNEH